MTELEAKQLNTGDSVVFKGLGGMGTVNPFLTAGHVYKVGGSWHGQPCGKGMIVGIAIDDHGQDSWCYPDELDTVACGTKGSCGHDPDDGPYPSYDDECDSEEFCKRLLGLQPTPKDDKEPPCRCSSPSNHDQDCAWKKWKDNQ